MAIAEGFRLYDEGGGRWGKGNSNIREDQLLAIMRSAHALMIAGDSDTAGRLLAVFAYTGVDAEC